MVTIKDNHIIVQEYFMKKNDKIKDWTNEEVILFHTIVHQSANNKKKYDNYKDVHTMILDEFNKRNIKHSSFDSLDEEVN